MSSSQVLLSGFPGGPLPVQAPDLLWVQNHLSIRNRHLYLHGDIVRKQAVLRRIAEGRCKLVNKLEI